MAVHVYVFLLVGCLLFFLARLGRLDWLHLQSAHSRTGAKRSRLHRQLKPRTPLDCPLSSRLHCLVDGRASTSSCARLV